MSGEPKGDGPDTMDRLSRGLEAMKVDDDINSSDTYHRIDHFAQGGGGESKLSGTPSGIDRITKLADRTLRQTGRNYKNRVINQRLGEISPGATGERRTKAAKASLKKTKKDCTTEFDLSAHASSGSVTPSGDRSELS